jgi:hypothetical protein
MCVIGIVGEVLLVFAFGFQRLDCGGPQKIVEHQYAIGIQAALAAGTEIVTLQGMQVEVDYL